MMQKLLDILEDSTRNPINIVHERIAAHGAGDLTDRDLLTVILGGDAPGAEETLQVERVLSYHGTSLVMARNVAEIVGDLRLPRDKACRLLAAMEFGRRRFAPESLDFPTIRSPEDAYLVFKHMEGYKRETLEAAYLNTRNKVIHREVIAVGTLGEVPIDPAEVFEPAVSLRAAAVIVAHNHPTGDSGPSPEDYKVTEELRHAGEVMRRPLLDHLVIGDQSFTSIMHDRIGVRAANLPARVAVLKTMLARRQSATADLPDRVE